VEALAAQNKGKILSGMQALPNQQAGNRTMCGEVQYNAQTRTVVTVLNLDRKDTANVRVRAFSSNNSAEVADVSFELKGRAGLNLKRKKGPLSVLPTDFAGVLFVSAEGNGSKRLMVTTKTLGLNKNSRAMSASALVCK
jgi:hypothetical protein